VAKSLRSVVYIKFKKVLSVFMTIRFLLVLTSGLLITACQQNSEQENNTPTAEVKPVKAEETIQPEVIKREVSAMSQKLPYRGTVKYFNLEGGFFGIVTDKGEKFLPMGLSKQYLMDGAIIEFSGTVNNDIMTIQQWGTPFKIEDIKMIKPGKPVDPKNSRHELM